MVNEHTALPYDMSRVVVLDIKTSGPVYDANEILQVSAIDGNGKDLLSTYVMPNKIQPWPSVIEKTHIMPQMVSNAPEFSQIQGKLQSIIDNADMIISYNGELNTKFLEANNIDMGETKPQIDMMRAFAPVYREKQDTRLGTRRTTDGYKWKPLDIACEHYGMIINKYDAAECTKGALAVAKQMYGNNLEKLSQEDINRYSIAQKQTNEPKQTKTNHMEDYMANENAQTQRDMSRVVVIDAETTGLNPSTDEILQVSVKDGNGKVLMDTYVKPEHNTSWPYAMKVNHITPQKVANAPVFDNVKEELQRILDSTDTFVSYNGAFDMKFLEANCINIDKTKPHLDVMKAFAPIYSKQTKDKAEASNKFAKWKKLTDACEYYHISIDAHNASSDVDGTLAVAKKIYGDNFEKLSEKDLHQYSIKYNTTKIQSRDEYYKQKRQRDGKVVPVSNRNQENRVVKENILGAYIYKAHPDIVAAIIRNDANGTLAKNIRVRMQDQKTRNGLCQ